MSNIEIITVLSDFAFVDQHGALHISVPRMLEAMGILDTQENRERCTRIAADHLASLLKDTPAVIAVTDS